jgi:hypothetical protein
VVLRREREAGPPGTTIPTSAPLLMKHGKRLKKGRARRCITWSGMVEESRAEREWEVFGDAVV